MSPLRAIRSAAWTWRPGYACPFRRREMLRHRVMVITAIISSVLLFLGWASIAFDEPLEPVERNPHVAIALLAHRIDKAEAKIERMDSEHRSLGFMLLGTLVSSVTGLAVYIIKSPRRDTQWDGIDRRRPRGADEDRHGVQ